MTPRKDAISEGRSRYEGLPCIKCGLCIRHVRDRKCVECSRKKRRIKQRNERAHFIEMGLNSKGKTRKVAISDQERRRRGYERLKVIRAKFIALGLTTKGKARRGRSKSKSNLRQKRNVAYRALIELGIDLGQNAFTPHKSPIEASNRAEAIKFGAKRYFTGKPCKYGHIASRSIFFGCDECRRNRRSLGMWRGKVSSKSSQKKRAIERKKAALIALSDLGIQIEI